MAKSRTTSLAAIRYVARLLTTSIVYVSTLIYVKWAFLHLHPTGLRVYVLAILPALPMVASLVVVGLYLAEEKDEFQRSILVQSILWGLGAALTVSTIWGTLEQFANAPHHSSFYAYLAFWVVMAISGAVIRLRCR